LLILHVSPFRAGRQRAAEPLQSPIPGPLRAQHFGASGAGSATVRPPTGGIWSLFSWQGKNKDGRPGRVWTVNGPSDSRMETLKKLGGQQIIFRPSFVRQSDFQIWK